MVDLAKEAFRTNNFDLAADIFERTIRENGPNSDLFLGLADSLSRGGQFSKAFHAYTNAYRYGKVTPEKLKHLVFGLIQTVKQDISNNGGIYEVKQNWMFSCGLCRGLFADPLTLPCGHSFCRKCLEKDQKKSCELCGVVHYRLKLRNLSGNVVLSNLIEKLFPSQASAVALKRKGNEFFANGDFKNAIGVYSKAIEIAPSDHIILSNRSHALAALDLYTEALKDAEKVVDFRPDWPKGYFRKGGALYGLGQYEDAAVCFLQCLALDQKVSSAKEYLSKSLDKILGALPPDDPKAHYLSAQSHPSLLQELIDGNFSSPLLPDLQHRDLSSTLEQLAQLVKDTIKVASGCVKEPKPKLVDQAPLQPPSELENPSLTSDLNLGAAAKTSALSSFATTSPSSASVDDIALSPAATSIAASQHRTGSTSDDTHDYENNDEDGETLEGRKLTKCSSFPDLSDVDHVGLEAATRPRTHSILIRQRTRSPNMNNLHSRKRLRHPSHSPTSSPSSPIHTSPQKLCKSNSSTSSAANSSSNSSYHATSTSPSCMDASSSPIPSPAPPASPSQLPSPSGTQQGESTNAALTAEDLECGLCYRLFFQPVTTPCGHTFCKKCLDRCLDHSTTCPMCKGNLSEYLAERRTAVTESIQTIIDTYFKEEHKERCRLNDEEMVELTRMGSGQQSEVPIFVCTLAFPTLPCPLHIFEPRYRLMVRQCMESGTRQFGMCVQMEDDDHFSDFGCMLEIRDVQYFPDGRSVVDCIGGRRFKVISRGTRDGYQTAKVEFIHDNPVVDAEDLQAVTSLQTEVYTLAETWMSRLPVATQSRIVQQMGSQPSMEANPAVGGNGASWLWWAVNVLPLDPQIKMTMLGMRSYKERLIALKKVLQYINRRASH